MAIDIERGYRSGCIGRIVALHADYYARTAGFGVQFESTVAGGLAEFCARYSEERDGLWLVVADGQVEGSIAIDGAHAASEGAHLRWFIVADAVRGHGLGSRLLATAIDFCRVCGYPRVHLSTFAGLDAARHLYESAGFRLVQQQRGSQWGREVDEQRFELQL